VAENLLPFPWVSLSPFAACPPVGKLLLHEFSLTTFASLNQLSCDYVENRNLSGTPAFCAYDGVTGAILLDQSDSACPRHNDMTITADQGGQLCFSSCPGVDLKGNPLSKVPQISDTLAIPDRSNLICQYTDVCAYRLSTGLDGGEGSNSPELCPEVSSETSGLCALRIPMSGPLSG
jgi:hypothetical protein